MDNVAMTAKTARRVRALSVLMGLLLPLLPLLGGCSAGGAGSLADMAAGSSAAEKEYAGANQGAAAMPAVPAPPAMNAPGSGFDGSASDSVATESVADSFVPGPEDGREVITTGYVDIAAGDPLAVSANVVALVSRMGGFVESRTENRPLDGNPGSAWLAIRIPSARVSEAIDGLSGLGGEVRDVNITRQDVTAQGADLDARISALQASTDRLLGLMNNAGNLEDLLRAERELSSRQAELDSLRSWRANLTDQVQMSSLNINISAPSEWRAAPRTGFLGALERGWNALLVSFRWIVVALGTLLPWLLVLGALTYLVRALLRWWRKRRSGGGGWVSVRDGRVGDSGVRDGGVRDGRLSDGHFSDKRGRSVRKPDWRASDVDEDGQQPGDGAA
jgi:hypothetical protein